METRTFTHEVVVKSDRAGIRLDNFLLSFPFNDFDPALSPSRATLQRWIAEGLISLNGSPTDDKSYRVKEGDRIRIEVTYPVDAQRPPPQALSIRIVYRDSHIVVLDKPPGVASHPVPTALSGTVINFLHHEKIPLPPTSNPLRPGVVHRLDRNTTGLMVVASTDVAYRALTDMIKRRELHREYLAIVVGNPPVSGTIEAAIQRDIYNRRRMAVGTDAQAKPARTHYRILEIYPAFALVDCTLDTGRTHQIRVHMSHIGYPVAGDPYYGGRRFYTLLQHTSRRFKRDPDHQRIADTLMLIGETIMSDQVHLLHASKLSFSHPVTGEPLEFTAEPHEKFRKVLNLLHTLPHNEVRDAV